MALFKFRVFYDEDENIFRDIEIKPVHTFFELKEIVIKGYNLPENGDAKIFQANDNWKKGNEMPLENPHKKKPAEKIKLVVGNYIDDPHQKFVFEFRGKHDFTFLMELISLMGSEKKDVEYPCISKSVGPSPFKKDDLLKHLDSKGKTTDEEYGVDSDEDDIEGMGNEGEEEEKEENEEEGSEAFGEEGSTDEFDF